MKSSDRSNTGVTAWLGGRVCVVVMALAVLACMLAPSPTRAQSAPAGNEHPRIDAAAQAKGEQEMTNPFGQPVPSTLSTEQKHAFSAQVDVGPLRDLALYHQGRIKIVDTLARETVQQILGRKDYQDFVVDPKDPRMAQRLKYDPLFTFMDLVIDPGYYVDRPLVHVEFLPLREELLKRAYTSNEEREWWKRVGRLKPSKIAGTIEAVTSEYGLEPGYAKAIDDVRNALLTYQHCWRSLKMVASEDQEKPWLHIAELPADAPARLAAAELGTAWRAGDATKANAAIAKLAAELPKINASKYPTTRRSLEAAYNRVNAFEWGYWFYAFALLGLLLAFGTGRKWLAVVGFVALAAAIGMHGFGFVSRCVIAERFAIQNQFESMTGLSLFATLVGTTIMLLRRQWLFGAAAAGVGFMVLVTATQTGIPGVSVEREAPILNTSVLLKYHVTTVLVSYGLIALGFMVSVFYLGTHYAAKFRAGARGTLAVAAPGIGAEEMDSFAAASGEALGLEGEAASTTRVLYDLDKAQMIILQLAFWTLGVGILLGAWWADHSWGRWWAFDPKELWALVTWIVYLVVIHVRFTPLKNRGLTTSWLSVLGFVVMLWTYFGVNLLLPGLHAYA